MNATQDDPHTDTLRPPLQPRQPAPHPCSRDPPPSLEYEFPLVPTSRFPISSVRQDGPQSSSATPPVHPPKRIHPRYDPLHILSQPLPPSPPPARVCDPIPPTPSVAPGVLADGVLTVKFPSVRRFLEDATLSPPECPPFPTDRRVLALVALAVFYHPLHPAHWVFWNREQKMNTANMVQSVLNTTPTPILSPIGWIDVHNNLWILGYTQAAYASRLATCPWYATYTPDEPENRMRLRKRKQRATANRASGEETADEDGDKISPPPRKRARTRRSTGSRRTKTKPKARSTSAAGEENNEGGPSTAPEADQTALFLAPDDPPTLTKAAKLERIASPDTLLCAIRAEGSVQPDLPDAEKAQGVRKSVRQRERRERATSAGSPASFVSTLTPSVGRGLSQAHTSRASSAVTPESVGGGESGSSTAVSLCGEEAMKAKLIKTVEEVLVEEEAAVAAEEDDVEAPPAKKPRLVRPRAKSGARARTAKKKTETVAEDANTTVTRARPKARSRARTRRR